MRGTRWDRLSFKRGTRLIMGNALVGRLLHDIGRLSVNIRYRTSLKELIRDGDEIVGAVLTRPLGEIAVRARRGVVLATGGIGWSDDLRKRLLPENTRRYSLSPASNTGDGILAGERVSGEIDSELNSPALWMPSSVMKQPDGHLSVFPHIMMDRARPGLLAVDKSGRRFVNEANSYHDFVQGMLQSNRVPASVPSYLVCDRSFIADYGIGLVHPKTRDLRRFVEAGYLFEGQHHRRARGRDRRRWRRAGANDRALQPLRRDRTRRRVRTWNERAQSLQRRCFEQTQPMPSQD